ncbi:MAG: hypothetical protein KME07_00995 [Pegethrix bostrychoides GSE-TBD4-15B]|jgi:hypothetical protein|uniref:Uncharacterized protein n=1 Tax=Pegethrix bostrychoides GSE-TBD4-15B TaxID=2839662 RepID=A0A951P6R4_9CYAN|nr:hypothetical protein [Pegethrix bostrychoides GSE-TBD4-15B]
MPAKTSQTELVTSKTVTCLWCHQKNRLYQQAAQGSYTCGSCQKQIPNPFGSSPPPPQSAAKSSKTFDFVILTGVVLAGVGLLTFSIRILSRGEQLPPVASMPVKSAVTASSPKPIPSLSVSSPSVPSPSVVLQNRSLPASKVLVSPTSSGDGKLKVSNGTARDAYVKLVDSVSRKLVTAFYVKSSANFTVEQIPDGTYAVLFVTGEDWDAKTKSFTRRGSFTKFDKSLNFVTKQASNGIQYTIIKLTLNPVVNGNATLSGVDEQEFGRY